MQAQPAWLIGHLKRAGTVPMHMASALQAKQRSQAGEARSVARAAGKEDLFLADTTRWQAEDAVIERRRSCCSAMSVLDSAINGPQSRDHRCSWGPPRAPPWKLTRGTS
jgi:hypothetical protein